MVSALKKKYIILKHRSYFKPPSKFRKKFYKRKANNSTVIFKKHAAPLNGLFVKKKNLMNRGKGGLPNTNFYVSPKKKKLLESITKILTLDLDKKIISEKKKGKVSSFKYLMMRNDLSLGLNRYKFKLITNTNIDNTYANVVDSLRYVLRKLPRRTWLRFKKGRFVFTFMLLMLFMDVFILSEYFNKLFYRTKVYFQRRLFYNFRKLLPGVFSVCKQYSLIKGIYLSFKGKIATTGGNRKKVLRMYSGIYNTSNFGIQHKYKFKQI